MRKKTELNNITTFCVNRFNRGSSQQWKHGDFNDLSREIRHETKVAISPITLKRIFGKITVDDDYLPQQSTLEALKIYGGYKPETIDEQGDPTDYQKTVLIAPNNKSYKTVVAIVVVFLVAVSLLYKVVWSNKQPEVSIAVASIEGLLPATVLFKIEVQEREDTIYANFGDKSSWTPLRASVKNISHGYLFPGVFKVKIQTKKQALDSTHVTIRSDKWIGFAYQRQADLPKNYYVFPANRSSLDSLFHVSNKKLYELGLDTVNSFFTRLCYYSPLQNISADDFIFEANVRNQVHDERIDCRGVKFQIAGIEKFIRFSLMGSGCSMRVLNVAGEKVYDGNTMDLSRFAVDLKRWHHVKVINRNKHVSLVLDGKLVFSDTYNDSLKELQGVFVEFEGNGFVKSCTLKSLDGKSLYYF